MKCDVVLQKDVSFVFQGKYTEYTEKCISNVRKVFPDSKIILSCWENDCENISARVKFLANKIVISSDPGAISFDKFKTDNLGRQLVSTLSGINAVDTEYCIKIRTDCYLKNSSVLKLLNKYKERVIVIDFTTLNPYKSGLYFHVCDWLFAGKTKNIKNIFSIPLPDEEYYKCYSNLDFCEYDICSRLRAESYIGYEFARRKYDLLFTYKNLKMRSTGLAKATELMFNECFYIVPALSIGLRSVKYKYFHFSTVANRLSSYEWIKKHKYFTLKSNPYSILSLVFECFILIPRKTIKKLKLFNYRLYKK